MEVQNLRVYERHGLVDPDRTPGGTRLYSQADLARLVRIATCSPRDSTWPASPGCSTSRPKSVAYAAPTRVYAARRPRPTRTDPPGNLGSPDVERRDQGPACDLAGSWPRDASRHRGRLTDRATATQRRQELLRLHTRACGSLDLLLEQLIADLFVYLVGEHS